MRSFARSVLTAVALGAAALTLTLAFPEEAEAQGCETGCVGHNSCEGDGYATCDAHCWSEPWGNPCVGTAQPCGVMTFDVPDATYAGNGHAVPAEAKETYLIVDCHGNVFGVAYSVDRARVVSKELRHLKLEPTVSQPVSSATATTDS